MGDCVTLQLGDVLDLPYDDRTFDVVWCQNVTMNIVDKAGLLAAVYRVLKPGGLFTSTEFSVGPGGGEMFFPVPWAYDPSLSLLDPEDMMRSRFLTAGFRIRDWIDYSDTVVENSERMSNAPQDKLTNRLILSEDIAERQRNTRRNLVERRIIYWMITAERPQ